jgi:hypothetical protein
MTTFTNEQLIKRIDKQIDINATIIERLGDDSAAASELAVDTATMDIKILDIARTALTAAELQQYREGVSQAIGLFANRNGTWMELCQGDAFEHPDGVLLYTAPQPLTDAERAELEQYRLTYKWREQLNDGDNDE